MFPRVVRAVYFREQSISRGGMYLLQRRCVRASCFQVPSAQARYPQKCAFRVSLLLRYMACIMWGSFAPRRRLGNRGLAFPLSLYLSIGIQALPSTHSLPQSRTPSRFCTLCERFYCCCLDVRMMSLQVALFLNFVLSSYRGLY